MKSSFAWSLVALAFASATTQAAVTAVSLGESGASMPVTIEALGTTILNNSHDVSERFSLHSSNAGVQFVRHIASVEDNICYYWFRSTGDPVVWTDTEQWSDVYWYVMDECIFVDGAVSGSDNFVLLRNGEGVNVGVIQMGFTDAVDVLQPSPAVMLAYAVDPDGISFAEAVAAIQAIPEPSATMLGAVALAGALLRRKRRD